MRTINFKTSYEDIITRIMGLFAYVEKGIVHKATDNPLGCYGKIVENINLISEIDDNLKEKISKEVIEKVSFNDEYELKINDKLIIPTYKLLDKEKITEDNNIDQYKLVLESGKYVLIDDLEDYEGDIFVKNYSFSFKTLINLYYKYRVYETNDDVIIDDNGNVITGFNKLKDFLEIGIGKVKVELEDYISEEDEQQKVDKEDINGKYVPEFIYLVEAQRLYNELVDLYTICCLYEIHTEEKPAIDKETEMNMCCKCRKFHDMGGLPMLKFLEKQKDLCEDISELYKAYADTDNRLTINYNVNLFSSDRDLGIVTPVGNKNIKLDEQIPTDLIFNTNSKLKSLRRQPKYYNALDEEEIPEPMEDWLYFYRVGHIANITVSNDSLGNILTENTNINDIVIKEDGKTEYVNDLYAYGDIIEKIVLSKTTQKEYGVLNGSIDEDEEFNKLMNAFKIVYWTDVHLKAKPSEINFDEDGNKLICYKNFDADYWYMTGKDGEDKNYHGIRYEEIYTFEEDSDIVNLIKEGKFDNYVKGVYDFEYDEQTLSENNDELKLFEKYSFSLYNNSNIEEKQVSNKKVKFDDVIANTTARIAINKTDLDKNCPPTETCDIIRNEFYEGINYTPTEEFNVFIERGVTSIFDKHIRFGEIKTMQDMEEFTNGSFFKLQE